MKIYGKESDYYDVALAYGQDPICKWTRKFEVHPTQGDNSFDFPEDMFGTKDWWHVNPKQRVNGKLQKAGLLSLHNNVGLVIPKYVFCGYVFFCGKVYPTLTLRDYGAKDKVFYSYKDFKKHLESKIGKEITTKILQRQLFSLRSKRYLGEELLGFMCQSMCNYSSDALHRINNIPVYAITEDGVLEGGSLKSLQFIKVMDPYTCLQEIEMYLSGYLGGQSPKMIETSDVVRLESHGFDKKISFRKRK